MRIFYASGRTPNGALTDSDIWRANLYGALVDLGHDVVEFDYDLEPLLENAEFNVPSKAEFIRAHRPKAVEALMSQVEAAHRDKPLDLFFSYFYTSCTTADAIRRIRDLGIATVNWYCNASYQLHLVSEIAPAYDFCLVPEKFRLENYRRLGANPIYCQEAANPNVYHPYEIPRELDVTFVGARYGDRPVYIGRLVDAGINTRVWGPSWQTSSGARLAATSWTRRLAKLRTPSGWRAGARWVTRRVAPSALPPRSPEVSLPPEVCGPPLSDEEMVRLYSRSKISLGFSTCGNTHLGERITQIRLRDFEAPMSGAFYMVEDLPEISEFFEVGKEIVCYTDPDDLVEKARYYLQHEEERERIRQAGYRRAHAEHTWQRRLSTAFQQMGLPA